MRFDYLARISHPRPLLSLFSADLAIDLGTVNTRIYSRDRVSWSTSPRPLLSMTVPAKCGRSARKPSKMLGRTPANIRMRPLKDGVIADFKVTEMLHYFIQKAHQRRTLVHPRIVISVPSEITQVEKRAVAESAYRAGAAEVHLVEQAMMAAIGAGMPITEPGGNLVVDIGGGTTDVAVISLSGMVYSVARCALAGNLYG